MRERLHHRIATLSAILSLILLSGSLLAPATFAQEEEVRVRVARLIDQLGSRSYDTRQAADEALEEVGLESRSQLEAAIESPDPEVRTRARRLLQQLKLQAMWQGTPISHDFKNTSTREIAAALAKQSGNPLATGDQYGSFQEGRINLQQTNVTFWQAIDSFCLASGNKFRPHYGSRNPGLVLVSGKLGDYPVAYAGPVRGQILSARRVFVEELDYEDHTTETTHTFQLGLLLGWEERFRLVAHRSQTEVLEALDPQRQKVLDNASTDNSWNVVDRGTQQLSTTLRLKPPVLAAKKLDRLALSWSVIAVGDMADLQIDPHSLGTVHHQEDLTVVLEKFKQRSPQRWEITLAVSRDRVVPKPEGILYVENEFQLLDAQNQQLELLSTSKLGITAATARLKMVFASDSSESRPDKLTIRYPRIRDQRNVRIEFKDVPLPVAVPE